MSSDDHEALRPFSQQSSSELEARAAELLHRVGTPPVFGPRERARVGDAISARLAGPLTPRTPWLAWAGAAAVAGALLFFVEARRSVPGQFDVAAGVTATVGPAGAMILRGPAEAIVAPERVRLQRGQLAVRARPTPITVVLPAAVVEIAPTGSALVTVESHRWLVAAYHDGVTVRVDESTFEIPAGRAYGEAGWLAAGPAPVELGAPSAAAPSAAVVVPERPAAPTSAAVPELSIPPAAHDQDDDTQPSEAVAPHASRHTHAPAAHAQRVATSIAMADAAPPEDRRVVPPSAPSVASQPSVDRAPTPITATPESALSVEARMVRLALTQLSGGDPRAALATLDEYHHRFTDGALATEADRARLEALLKLERRRDALALLEHSGLVDVAVELRVLRGELRVEMKHDAAACADFDAVLTHASGSVSERALWGRAVCRSHGGDASATRAAVEAYLAQFPSGQFSKEASRLLHP